jgi:DNA-binding transcriptional LysR family regulator
VFEAVEIPTIEGLVAAGFGVAVVPVPREPDARVVHIPLTNAAAKREVGVVWSDARPASAPVERFVSFLTAIRDRRGAGHQ